MRTTQTKAITLVEIMVTLLIFSLVISGLYLTFMTGNRSWAVTSTSVLLQQETRGALLAMVKELREASNIFITQDSGGVTINFNRPTIGIVSYSWSREGDNARKIIRKNLTNTRILANNISALSFTYFKNAVLIDVTAATTQEGEQPASFNLKEKVALRSKVGPFM